MDRIYLSPPHMSNVERDLLLAAFDNNWIAPVGPELAMFEAEFAERQGVEHAVAVASGTAGLHLSLLLVGTKPGDLVIVPSFTFAATANAVRYCGAEPIFVDSEESTWNLDPKLVDQALDDAARSGQKVAAVMSVDLYGQCADHAPIRAACDRFGVALIEDAAEAVGATWEGAGAGSFGDIGVFSFNGNKLMTTGGGGMIVSADQTAVDRARHLATQAREPTLHYEHRDLGFNYRLSNPLAAIGLGQLRRLDELLARRAEIRARYETAFSGVSGVSFNPIDRRGVANNWLTVMVLDDHAAATPAQLIAALEAVNAEARPAWKPMHQQPFYADCKMYGGAVADAAFERGVCLPSGSSLTAAELDRVIDAALGVLT